jgi:predicted amidohydrolase YtcJ
MKAQGVRLCWVTTHAGRSCGTQPLQGLRGRLEELAWKHNQARKGLRVIDAGGGFQNYPDDYAVIEELHHQGALTVRLAYNLFTQKPQQELMDFERWTQMTRPGAGDDFYRMNGAGEMLVFSAADFEDFLEPRPAILVIFFVTYLAK